MPLITLVSFISLPLETLTIARSVGDSCCCSEVEFRNFTFQFLMASISKPVLILAIGQFVIAVILFWVLPISDAAQVNKETDIRLSIGLVCLPPSTFTCCRFLLRSFQWRTILLNWTRSMFMIVSNLTG